MVSSKDVARLSGVSQATVSRVMNQPDKVSEKTKEKVIRAMKELNYRPNLVARSLITKETKTIALISGKLQNAFFVETTNIISKLANEKGYSIMVYFDNGENTQEIINYVLSMKVDGILMSSVKLDSPITEDIIESNLPYVFFNRRPKNDSNYVVINNYLAGELITEHLISLNHTNIAYISGELDISTFLERKEGFQNVMRKNKLNSEDFLIYTDTSAKEVERVTLKLLAMEHRPSAIIFATDTMAHVGMDVILSYGLSIPEDISVAAIDNNNMSAHAAVQLTTVGNKEGMGAIAINNLIDMINESDNIRTKVILEPELIVRRTTKYYD